MKIKFLYMTTTGYVQEGSGAVLGRQDEALRLHSCLWICSTFQEVPCWTATGEWALCALRQDSESQSSSYFLQKFSAHLSPPQDLLCQGMAAHQKELLCLHFQDRSGTIYWTLSAHASSSIHSRCPLIPVLIMFLFLEDHHCGNHWVNSVPQNKDAYKERGWWF